MTTEDEIRSFVRNMEVSLVAALRRGANVSLEWYAGSTDVVIDGMITDQAHTGELLFKIRVLPGQSRPTLEGR